MHGRFHLELPPGTSRKHTSPSGARAVPAAADGVRRPGGRPALSRRRGGSQALTTSSSLNADGRSLDTTTDTTMIRNATPAMP